jgi:hypothetical protein
MNISPEALAEIAARASTFEERRSNGLLVRDHEPDDGRVERRLAEWCERAAKGDDRLFAEVLAFRGLDVDSAKRFLEPMRIADPARIPTWTQRLQAGLCIAEDPARAAGVRCLDGSLPLPFDRLLTPFVTASVEALRERSGPH